MPPVTSLVPRRRAEPASAPMPAASARTSVRIQADIDATAAEAQAASTQIVALNGQTREILLSGDDERHERHEAEIARLSRILARASARHEALSAEHARVSEGERERDEAEAKALLLASAKDAVAAVEAKYGTAYTAHAEAIAAFLAEVQEAGRLASAARIDPPFAGLRVEPPTIIPPTRTPYEAYVDDQGNPTQNPHPYKPDGMLDRSRTRELRTFYQDVPGRTERNRSLPPFLDLVRLPKIDGDGDHYQGADPAKDNRWRRP